MRLLERNNAGEVQLTEEFGDNVPAYAILSHTWGTEEVVFRDVADNVGQDKLGYNKISFCGDQAWRDGLRYFWIDSCCIDKTNSTELQEAINSMFRWYRNASRCYVYLSDVSVSSRDEEQIQLAFLKSRWFSRGWTLQELLAPPSLAFFSKEGIYLGNKNSLEQQIHQATQIPVDALRGRPLSNFSVPERMLWVKNRETTRKEDKVYSLFGIFDVHMPLLYGEGRDRAFKRLVEEVSRGVGEDLLSMSIMNDETFNSSTERNITPYYHSTRMDPTQDQPGAQLGNANNYYVSHSSGPVVDDGGFGSHADNQNDLCIPEVG